jgi:hypothetical protein
MLWLVVDVETIVPIASPMVSMPPLRRVIPSSTAPRFAVCSLKMAWWASRAVCWAVSSRLIDSSRLGIPTTTSLARMSVVSFKA